jgi:RNA polymerase sigma factor (TIGR02999 family)
MHEVTCILSAIENGDSRAAEQLLPLVYDELRRLAAEKMAQEKPGQTLQATALVHEAYLRLVDGKVARHWQSRTHFFTTAAEAMRRILVDQARRKGRLKRGGAMDRIEFNPDCAISESSSPDLLALDEALTRLAGRDPAGAELVKLRFFAGMTMSEAADALGVSLATAERYWTFAKAWLFAELSDHSATPTMENRESP